MTHAFFSLAELGFRPFFQQQLALDETGQPLRVTDRQGGRLTLLGARGSQSAELPGRWRQLSPEAHPVIGDWLIVDDAGRPSRLLERSSFLARRAAGHGNATQGMAANIDTLFVVSSCNRDFNLSRLERYLVLAQEGGAQPVVLLTKADLADEPEAFRRRAETLKSALMVLTLDAHDPQTRNELAPWLGVGQTVAFLGSSGVGKSTLINTLCGRNRHTTQPIRVQDEKGRHTTTARSMIPMEAGAWLIDTPGMRELRLGESGEGMKEIFAEIDELALNCQYRDCRHDGDHGCAVAAAVAAGTLDHRRLANYLKLRLEQERLQESQREKRERGRRLSHMVNQVKKVKYGRR